MSTPRKPADPAGKSTTRKPATAAGKSPLLKPSRSATPGPTTRAGAKQADAGKVSRGVAAAAPRDAAKTEPKPDFSKVKGSVRSTAEPTPKADFSKVRSSVSSTAQAVGERSYTVKKGDTLSHIAKAHYGKASRWPRIFEANRDQLDDPDRIKPGQVLKIPAAAD